MPDSQITDAQEEAKLREGLASGALFSQEKADALASSEDNEVRPTEQNNQDKTTEQKIPLKKEDKKIERKSESVSEKKTSKPIQNGTDKNGKLNGKEVKTEEQPVSRGEERLNKIRLQIDEDKKKLNQERETYVSPAAQREIDRLTQELTAQKAQSEYTPDQLRQWADETLEEAVNATDPAQKAKLKQNAAKMREKANQVEKAQKEAEGVKVQVEQRTKAQKEQFNRTWDDNLKKAVEEYPDLAQPGSPIHYEAMQLLDHPDPYWRQALRGSPHGISTVAYLAHLKVEADAASDLREELNELKDKLKGSLRKLGLGRGGVTQPIGEKDFDSMTEAEQERSLRERLSQGLSL